MVQVPSLSDLAKRQCFKHSYLITDVGVASYDIVKPILKRLPAKQLAQIEQSCPHIRPSSDELWKELIQHDFPKNPLPKSNFKKYYGKYYKEREKHLQSASNKLRLRMAQLSNNKSKSKIISLDKDPSSYINKTQAAARRNAIRKPKPNSNTPPPTTTILQKAQKDVRAKNLIFANNNFANLNNSRPLNAEEAKRRREEAAQKIIKLKSASTIGGKYKSSQSYTTINFDINGDADSNETLDDINNDLFSCKDKGIDNIRKKVIAVSEKECLNAHKKNDSNISINTNTNNKNENFQTNSKTDNKLPLKPISSPVKNPSVNIFHKRSSLFIHENPLNRKTKVLKTSTHSSTLPDKKPVLINASISKDDDIDSLFEEPLETKNKISISNFLNDNINYSKSKEQFADLNKKKGILQNPKAPVKILKRTPLSVSKGRPSSIFQSIRMTQKNKS